MHFGLTGFAAVVPRGSLSVEQRDAGKGLQPPWLARRFVASAIGLALAIGVSGEAYAQLAAAQGSKFQVNVGTTADQGYPQVSPTGAGSFVIVWESDYTPVGVEILLRRFDANGAPLSGDVVVNQETALAVGLSNGDFSLASDASGNFVVTWVDDGDDSGGEANDIAARLFDASGNPLGDQFAVNEVTESYQSHPEVSMAPSGDFVIVWTGPFDEQNVSGRRFDASGAPLSSEFVVNTHTAGDQGPIGLVNVASDAAGDFVVVWASYDGYPLTVAGQRYKADGTPEGGEFQIHDHISYDYFSDIGLAAHDDGSFAVAWASDESGVGYSDDVVARLYNDKGGAKGNTFVVSDDSAGDLDQGYYGTSVATLGSDLYVVAWQAELPSGYAISGQLLDRSGDPVGPVFTVSDISYDAKFSPQVVAVGEEDFVATWAASGQDGSGTGIFARRMTIGGGAAEVPVNGTRLKITNRLPDNPVKNRAIWRVKDPSAGPPGIGSTDDPRCNGDASGTVKAQLRFFSNDSGHDSGEIDLPCQNWLLKSTSTGHRFDYRDRRFESGACSHVSVRAGSLSASCKGKGGLAYDLVPGSDEGTVHTVLSLGEVDYCTDSVAPPNTNGSNGKRFVGRNTPRPASCASPL